MDLLDRSVEGKVQYKNIEHIFYCNSKNTLNNHEGNGFVDAVGAGVLVCEKKC